MPDYSKSKIYAIRSFQTDECYIGSTCQNLAMRLGGHKRNYKSWKNGKTNFTSSFILLDKYDDCHIELIEDVECKSKEELNRREGQVIRNTENCVNKQIAGRTQKEYQTDNLNKIKKLNKEYYSENLDEIKKRHKEYYIDNTDMLIEYQKKYNKENADVIREKRKQHYQNNIDIIREKSKQHYQKAKQKIVCECGCEVSKKTLTRHKKTKKHLDYLENL